MSLTLTLQEVQGADGNPNVLVNYGSDAAIKYINSIVISRKPTDDTNPADFKEIFADLRPFSNTYPDFPPFSKTTQDTGVTVNGEVSPLVSGKTYDYAFDVVVSAGEQIPIMSAQITIGSGGAAKVITGTTQHGKKK